MTVGIATLDSVHGTGTLDDYQAGYPLFCDHNLLRDAILHWREDVGTANLDDTTILPAVVCDGFTHLPAYWTGGGTAGLYVDFGEAVSYDVVALFLPTGTAAYSSGTSLSIVAANASDFSDAVTLYGQSETPGVSGDRWIFPLLGNATEAKIVTARYMFIEFDGAPGLAPSEIFVGLRCQMQSCDDMPVLRVSVDRAAYETTVPNGSTSRRGKFHGRSIFESSYIIIGSTRATDVRGVIQTDDEPVLYCSSPYDALSDQESEKKSSNYLLMLGHVDSGVRSVLEVETSGQYRADIRLVEQGPPFFYGLRVDE